MTAESNTPSKTFPPAGYIWFRVGQQTYTLTNEEAWQIAWELIGHLVDQRDKAA